MLHERRKQNKRRNKKLKNDNDIVDVDDHTKKILRNLNDEKFVNLSQYLHEFNQIEFASQIFKFKKRRRQQIEYRKKKI